MTDFSDIDSRVLILALPSIAVLGLLIWHSLSALPRRRALAFWISVAVYGVLRGLGVRAVTRSIGASFPYEIRNPLLAIGGVTAQEVVGWAVVAYLAWWIGARFTRHVFLQVAWASLFLGAMSWMIEAAAIAARWWHWTVPTASRVFLNVPAIGIVDWFFVGFDFLLPFVAITAPARVRWRHFALAFFPVHFAGHLLPGIWLHAVHWGLVLAVLWLALRDEREDRAFSESRGWIPTIGFAAIAIDVALVDLLVVRRPELLQSIAPGVAIWIAAARPPLALATALVSAAAAFALPSMLVASAAAAAGPVLQWLRRRRLTIAAIALVALFAVLFHRHTLEQRNDLTRRLDAAIAARDRGHLRDASALFAAIARDHPTSYVPLALGAEIDFRSNRLDEARTKLVRAVEIKQDFVRGYRMLAAIELRQGSHEEALKWAARGLEVAPGDPRLRELAQRLRERAVRRGS